MEKKYVVSETQLKTVIKNVIKEQGLYGNNNDTVDYDLPEYLSDVIVLSELESWNDVERSIKEIHKRVMRLEKGLTSAGSHQKAYTMDDDFSSKRHKASKGTETKIDSEERDDELKAEIEALQQMFKKDRKEDS
jgi:hypothetical protein